MRMITRMEAGARTRRMSPSERKPFEEIAAICLLLHTVSFRNVLSSKEIDRLEDRYGKLKKKLQGMGADDLTSDSFFKIYNEQLVFMREQEEGLANIVEFLKKALQKL